MWRVMGSSPERVRIMDIGDVIYYRQIKDYSDQVYEGSRDLQRAVQRGKITIVEHSSTPVSINTPQGNSSLTINNSSGPVDLESLKQAIREVLPDTKKNTESLRDIIPSIVDMVRQEVSSVLNSAKISGSVSSSEKIQRSEFMGPEYIPTVNSDGMVSNISVESKKVSGSDVSSNLDLLRKLKQQSK